MATETECKELILDRLAELVPTATATTLPKLAQAFAHLKSEDALNSMLDKYTEVMEKNHKSMEEEYDALIQRIGK